MSGVSAFGVRIRVRQVIDIPRHDLTREERTCLDQALHYARRGIEFYITGYLSERSCRILRSRGTDSENSGKFHYVDNGKFYGTSDSNYSEASERFNYASKKFAELARLATTEGVAESACKAALRSERIALRMDRRVANVVKQRVSDKYL